MFRFISESASQIIAYELGSSKSREEKECVSVVARALALFSENHAPNYNVVDNSSESVIYMGCIYNKLKRTIISSSHVQKNNMKSRNINIDRFYLKHPSVAFYETLQYEGNRMQNLNIDFPICMSCNCSTIKEIMCVHCFHMFRDRFEHSKPCDFGSHEYWLQDHLFYCSDQNLEYKDREEILDEWFLSWNDISHLFFQTIQSYSNYQSHQSEKNQIETNKHYFESLLIPGNGRSSIPFEIRNLGLFHEIMVTDVIPEIVHYMKEITNKTNSMLMMEDKNQEIFYPIKQHKKNLIIQDLRFMVDDVTQSQFTSHRFDLILDKGVLDALACCLTTSSSSSSSSILLRSAVDEYFRLLKENGYLILISGRHRSLVLKLFHCFDHPSPSFAKNESFWVLVDETKFKFETINNIWECGYYVFMKKE